MRELLLLDRRAANSSEILSRDYFRRSETMSRLQSFLSEVKVNGGYLLIEVFSDLMRLLLAALASQIPSTRICIGSSFFLHLFFKFNTNY